MPQRFLRPGIRTSERWNRTSFRAQSLYIGIMTLVDDFGRYDGRVRLLHGEIFGLRDDVKPQQTAAAFEELCRNRLIRHYLVNDKEYLQVCLWNERSRSETSKYPDPPQESAAERSEILLPSPSPSSLAISHRQRQNGSGEPATLQEWIEELRKDDTYKGIDVKREFGKMTNWCRAHKVNPTRRRFVNWLNRVDRPIVPDKPKPASRLPLPTEFVEWATTTYPANEEITKWKTWDDVPVSIRAEWRWKKEKLIA